MKLSTGVLSCEVTASTRFARRGRSGQRKDSRADDRADAQRGQIERGQGALHLAIRMLPLRASEGPGSWS